MSQYYNLYYLNYQKAFEISMLIDNNIIESIERSSSTDMSGSGEAKADATMLANLPIFGKYMPHLAINGNGQVSKSGSTLDNINVVSTKSTILQPIVNKAKNVRKLSENKIGDLIKLPNMELSIENSDDILSTKTLLSGLINNVSVDGFGEMDMSKLFHVFLKDTSYIITGNGKGKFFENNSVVIKIPMVAEHELESQYSVYDLEIGKVTIIGIYKGLYPKDKLLDQIDMVKKMKNNSPKIDSSELETDDGAEEESVPPEISEKIHFIDVVAIIQDLNLTGSDK